MTLRKGENSGIFKRKHYNALGEEFALEEALDLSEDRMSEYTSLLTYWLASNPST